MHTFSKALSHCVQLQKGVCSCIK
uniref:Uncharacterized protein n=1 Tax=Anguilla anguilla TaxID=7936 RepID=A0A0E9QKB1_ANGAN